MKLSPLALSVLLAVPAHAFVSQTPTFASTAIMSAHKKADFAGAAAVALTTVGALAAPQVAMAAPVTVIRETESLVSANNAPESAISSSNLMLSAFGSPLNTGSSGGTFDTLDFSLPSYGDATGGSTESKPAPSPAPAPAPAFTTSDEPSATEKRAADKEEKERAKAEKEDAKRQEEEKKAAEAAEKQRKADQKAERLAAEREKQRLAVESSAKAKDELDLPTLPAVKAPEVKAPEVKAPEVKVPEIKSPEISLPSLDVPAVKLPSFSAPDISAPDIKMPSFSMPKVDMPKIEAPKVNLDFPSIAPAPTPAPKPIAPPPAPKPIAPPPAPKTSSYDYDFDIAPKPSPAVVSEPEEPVEAQEIRDERAVVAKGNYKTADAGARELEAQAKVARGKANELKKVFKEKKDDACKTRLGGKALCIRPLNSGY